MIFPSYQALCYFYVFRNKKIKRISLRQPVWDRNEKPTISTFNVTHKDFPPTSVKGCIINFHSLFKAYILNGTKIGSWGEKKYQILQ